MKPRKRLGIPAEAGMGVDASFRLQQEDGRSARWEGTTAWGENEKGVAAHAGNPLTSVVPRTTVEVGETWMLSPLIKCLLSCYQSLSDAFMRFVQLKWSCRVLDIFARQKDDILFAAELKVDLVWLEIVSCFTIFNIGTHK